MLIQSVALALGGVVYPSSALLAMRGRLVLGLGTGVACPGDVAASSGVVNDAAASGAALGDVGASSALTSDVEASGATLDDAAASNAAIGDTIPDCP